MAASTKEQDDPPSLARVSAEERELSVAAPPPQPSATTMPGEPNKRTTNPIVTGGSLVALKYNGGVLVAADTLGSYGSLARFENICRMSTVGVAGDTLLAAGGDYSDYQQMLKMIESQANAEYCADDGAAMSASMMHQWLTRIMYQRRSKMNPLWNSIVIMGYRNGESYLGTTDLYGTMYTDNFIVSRPPLGVFFLSFFFLRALSRPFPLSSLAARAFL